MLIKNTADHYGIVAQALHWLMVLMLIGMIVVGFIMHDLPLGLLKIQLYGLHKSFGMCILFLAAFRLLWKLINIQPALPAHTRWYEKFGAHSVHWILYGLLFFIPLMGWMMSSSAGLTVSVFGWFSMPDLVGPDKEAMKIYRDRHELGVYILLGVAALHILAALVHHFYYKDNILVRMLIPAKNKV